MVLVYVVIAAIAVQWFGMVQYGVMLGPAVNVETFPQAVYLCYSMAFGGEWHILLRDLMVAPPYCTPEGPNVRFSDCGSPLQAVLLIFVIKIFAEGMMLNLCVGLILDNFVFITDDFDFVGERRTASPRRSMPYCPYAIAVNVIKVLPFTCSIIKCPLIVLKQRKLD